MRPNVYFDGDISAVIKFHCTKTQTSIAEYIHTVVVKDLQKKYPQLMLDIKKETVTR